MLGITAMQQLGKLANPAAGKANVNLEAAQTTIDTLDMLAAKTEGRLDNDEARLLKDTIATLKMNYVETREEEKKAQEHGGPTAQSDSAQQSQREPQAQPPEGQDKTSEAKPEKEAAKDPKFHKSYE